MNLQELGQQHTSQAYANIYKSQFGVEVDLNELNIDDSIKLWNKTRRTISEVRHSKKIHTSQYNPSYLKMVMLEQALSSKIKELKEAGDAGSFGKNNTSKEDNMNTIVPGKNADEYANTLKKSASGEDVTEECAKLRKMGVKEGLVRICENRHTSIKFMRKLVESKKAKRNIMEGDVENAQVVLAAQDIVDRIQKMLEDMVDVQYKDIPGLADQIKGEMGVDQAVQFKDAMTQALQTLASQLEATKTEMENAVGIITGDEVGMPADMGLGDDMDTNGIGDELGDDMDGLDDLGADAGDEFDSEVADLGRERR
jgi:hypothetical protein